ncbi:MAG: hypothetical protein JNM68_16940 [Dinghuibacter sp.]|nr:hypothetical protein [Dinghuibacter sp.]
MQPVTDNEITRKMIGFIESLGIPVKFTTGIEGTFLPGLRIENGAILADEQVHFYPGDLLHEAGHLAVVPAAERATLCNEDIGRREHHAAEEMMSIAWSFAACLHLGIDPLVVFHENGYKNGGAEIAENFSKGQYFGVPMLQWIGLTHDPAGKELPENAVLFPKMIKWMRD